MTRRPKRKPDRIIPIPQERYDRDFTGPDAINKALATFGGHDSMVLIVNREDQKNGFGTAIRRDTVPDHEAFAQGITARGEDLAKQLFVMMHGGVEEEDITLITGLIFAVAWQVWHKDTTADQIKGVHVILSPTAQATVLIHPMERH